MWFISQAFKDFNVVGWVVWCFLLLVYKKHFMLEQTRSRHSAVCSRLGPITRQHLAAQREAILALAARSDRTWSTLRRRCTWMHHDPLLLITFLYEHHSSVCRMVATKTGSVVFTSAAPSSSSSGRRYVTASYSDWLSAVTEFIYQSSKVKLTLEQKRLGPMIPAAKDLLVFW